MEICGLILEEIADIAAIVKVVTDTGFCIDAQLGQNTILHAQTTSYRPLHTVLTHHYIHPVGIDLGIMGSTDHFSALKNWMIENKLVSLPSHLKTIEPMEVHRGSGLCVIQKLQK